VGPVFEFEELPDDIPVMIREGEGGRPIIVINSRLTRVERAKALETGKRMLRERRRRVIIHLGMLGDWGSRLAQVGDACRGPAAVVAGGALAMTMTVGSDVAVAPSPQRTPWYVAQGPSMSRAPGREPATLAPVAVGTSRAPAVRPSGPPRTRPAAVGPRPEVRPDSADRDTAAERREPLAPSTRRADAGERPAHRPVPAETEAAAAASTTRPTREVAPTRGPVEPPASEPADPLASPAPPVTGPSPEPEPRPEPEPEPEREPEPTPRPSASIGAEVDVDVPPLSDLDGAVRDALKSPLGIGGDCDGRVDLELIGLRACVGG
jgi:hypothetical protein